MLYNQSEFAIFTNCTRQNVSKSVKQGFLIKTSDGKIDSDDPINREWIELRFLNDSAIKERRFSDIKQESHIKKRTKSKNDTKNTLLNNKPPKIQNNDSDDDEVPLQRQKLQYEVAKMKEQYEKLALDNRKARSELVERETLAAAVFGYLIALNKNILAMPESFIDDFQAKLKIGKSRPELCDILRGPITQAIVDTKDQIKKEIEKYKRDIKQDEQEEKK